MNEREIGGSGGSPLAGRNLSAVEWERVCALIAWRFGWSESDLQECLKTGLLPIVSVSSGSGEPHGRPGLFIKRPPIDMGTLVLGGRP